MNEHNTLRTNAYLTYVSLSDTVLIILLLFAIFIITSFLPHYMINHKAYADGLSVENLPPDHRRLIHCIRLTRCLFIFIPDIPFPLFVFIFIDDPLLGIFIPGMPNPRLYAVISVGCSLT